MNFLRLIIKSNVPTVESLAWNKSWYLHDFILPKTEEEVYEQIWLTEDESTSIHYIEDPLIDIRYLFIHGSKQVEVINAISSYLDLFQRGEIFEMIHKAASTEEYIQAIYHLGVTANHDYDKEIFELFKAVFAHSEPKVRNAAILATSYVGWKEFEEPLKNLSDSDPEKEVQEFAKFTLQSLRTRNWDTGLNT